MACGSTRCMPSPTPPSAVLQELGRALREHGPSPSPRATSTRSIPAAEGAGGCGLHAQWTDDSTTRSTPCSPASAPATTRNSAPLIRWPRPWPAVRLHGPALPTAGAVTAYRPKASRPRATWSASRTTTRRQTHAGERIAPWRLREPQARGRGRAALALLPLLFWESSGRDCALPLLRSHSARTLCGQCAGEGRGVRSLLWQGEAPIQSPETFERSRIDPALRERAPNARLTPSTRTDPAAEDPSRPVAPEQAGLGGQGRGGDDRDAALERGAARL